MMDINMKNRQYRGQQMSVFNCLRHDPDIVGNDLDLNNYNNTCRELTAYYICIFILESVLAQSLYPFKI